MSENPTYEELKQRIRELEKESAEHKQAEEALRESEKTFRRAFEDSESGIVIADIDGRYLQVNKAMSKIFGYTKEELLSKTIRDISFPGEPDQGSDVVKKLWSSESDGIAMEKRYVHKDGHIVWGAITVSPVYDDSGKTIATLGQLQDITERKKAEEALMQSEDKFRTVAEQSPNMIFINKMGQVVYQNKRCEEMMGYKSEEICSPDFDFYTLLAPESLELARSSLKKHLIGTDVESLEYTLIKKDGQQINTVIGTKLIDYEGERAILGIVTDITERKRNEEELRMQSQALTNILEGVNIVQADSGVFIFTNSAYTEMLGYECGELIGKHVSLINASTDVSPEETAEKIISILNRTGTWEGEVENIKKDGTRILTYAKVSAFEHSTHGKLLIGIQEDITERKQAEVALRESENKFRSLFDFSPQGVTLTEVETGKIVDANEKFCETCGYTKEELLGRTTTEIGFYSKADRTRFIKQFQRSGQVNALEMDFRAKDGSIINALMFSRMIEIGGNNLILSIFVDVTEKKHLEAQLHQSQKMESIGTLAGGIAHDFNNILGIIIGNTELAIMDVPEWNPAKECLNEIRVASMRAKDVVRHILSFARKTPAQRQPIQISTIIRDSLKLMRASIPTTIEIRQNISCTTEMILADPTEVNQILMNLCTNAADAMSDDGDVLDVSLTNEE